MLTRIILMCIACSLASTNPQWKFANRYQSLFSYKSRSYWMPEPENIPGEDSVKVSLYYEALCPFSQEFIKDELLPGYQVLGDALNLDLVPYGKAKIRQVHGKWIVTCQHGPKECFANRLQACALGLNYTQTNTMNFIGCVMSTDTPQNKQIAKKCAQKNKLSWTDIKACSNTQQGDELVEEMRNKTESLEPKLVYVPHIRFNDIYDQNREDSARDNFLETVCDLFEEKPEGCRS